MRILEVSDSEGAAAFSGKLSRRWGHEVIKVESPARPGPEVPADLYLNGGKRRVALDLDTAGDRDRLDALARSCDVLVTDRSVQDIERLDLLNLGGGDGPRVRLSITPFGLTGPYAHAPATEASLLALGGYSYIIGDPEKAPLTFVGRYASFQGGTLGYVAALATARSLAPGAPSVQIDISLMECLAALHQSTYSKALATGQARERAGNRMDGAPNSLLPTRDGWVGVSFQQQFWFSFATMIGRPDLAEGHPLATNAGRMQHYDELIEIVDEVFRERDTHEIFDEAQGTWRIPIGKLLGVLEALDDPHLNARDFWRPIEGAAPEHGTLCVPGSPFRFGGESLPIELAPHPMGADTEQVLSEPAPGPVATPGARARTAATRPLDGIRVLDLTRVWSGPTTGRILGDLGADVIKIEASTDRGPRNVPRGYPVSPETASMPWNGQKLFNQLQRNRRSLCVNLKTAEGKDLFLQLVRESDVVLENFSARAMSRLGLGYEALRAANERIIYAPMPAFGRTGPYRDYVGLGTSVEPLATIPTLLGYPGDHAHATAIAIPDPMAGTMAAAAILTALARRDETGLGSELDFSQQEVSIGFIGEYFIEAQLTGHDQERIGNQDPRYAPHDTYRCRGDDAWIAIAARSDEEWDALNRVASRGWEADERFTSLPRRLSHRRELDELIAAWTLTQDKHELMRALMNAGVPAGGALTGPELMSDPQLTARGFFADLAHPVTGSHRFDGAPFCFDGERGYDDWRPAPMLGEHNHEVLGSVLGLPGDEVDWLTALGVLATQAPE
jgi:crotonobetainyl-CoA:carnitine CoA-transferase CaiB-like acyl-CoA transferase